MGRHAYRQREVQLMKFENLLFEVNDGVARVTINSLELAQELMGAALCCDEDPAIRAVILTGQGKVFCGGGDLRAFAAQGEALPSHLKETTTCLHTAVSRFNRMNAPLVAAVNGGAGGAGMSLACASDLVVASEKAKFTMAYTGVGLVPDGSSTYFLARLVGLRRALELTLTNRTLSASEALDWGLVTRVVPEAEVLSEAERLAQSLAVGASFALAAAKRLLYSGLNQTLETQMEFESRAMADAARTADAREGIAAFLEKRKPNFGGRDAR
jgi:2-(1,2-epoxy-1,2-dihydrophenyl)acetyl-CoA isomerase